MKATHCVVFFILSIFIWIVILFFVKFKQILEL